MKNMDELAKQKTEIVAKINQAVKDGNEEAFSEAFLEYTEILQDAVMAEARGMVQAADNQILAGRGIRALTSEETKYYQKIIEAMKSSNPKQALSGFDNVLPETIINAVFEDITEEHPLLSLINFQNTAALIKYLYSVSDGQNLAWWGALCSEIEATVNAEFKLLNLEQTKLSAYVPVCKAMLDLGPAWLDRYVRTILAEAIANGLEDGIINGRGMAEAEIGGAAKPAIYEPIGMIRNLAGASVPGVGYAEKIPVPIADFLPETYLPIISDLTVGPSGLNRRVTEVLLVVNPIDYLTKIAPATIHRKPDGNYVLDIFPFPTRVVQSTHMEQGKAVLGLPKRYLMAMGTGKGGRIEYSDEYHFLEDERIYLIKFYGTGRPLDNNSFIVLDISNVKPIAPAVRVISWPDATLKSLGAQGPVGTDLTIAPVFDKNVHYYSVTYTDAVGTAGTTNKGKVTAVATDANAVVTATLNGSAYTLGAELTWTEGANVIVITVVNGDVTEMYVLVVTYEDTSAA
jgi:hypothetical protein